MKKKILVLCTGNSCRSQIAEGYLRYFVGDKAEVYSAGVETHGIHPGAVATMKEDGIDISNHTSNNVDEYRDIKFDYMITVCDNVRERCPNFPTKTVKFHQNFPDPAKAQGSEEEITAEFRCVWEMIKAYCKQFIEEKFRIKNIKNIKNMKTVESEKGQTPSITTNTKEMVKQQYNELALLAGADLSKCCCNSAEPSKRVFTIMSEDYSKLKGYEPDADLGVGCGLPTQYAGIKAGDMVVDLGSGAGNDCFIAREETGETGGVIGIDFAPQMLAKARANATKRGFTNVKFLEGDIENMPLSDATADVVVSNCVLNLLPRKDKIFKEIYRVLKSGGHFCISDVVLNGIFPKEFTDNASMYAGCIASAIQREDYLSEIEKAYFTDIKVERTKTVIIPDEVLQEHLDEATIQKYKAGNVGIYSITVTGKKSD